ncbi:TonB-dependent receptor plug domain-containing protein [Sphingomonas flavalba]|uniref:TonB-dependent receptor plug domain-containing protein n=1 Tax=Sphingomonas flavalba TaxID=2559804 RepID=UPI0039DFBF45
MTYRLLVTSAAAVALVPAVAVAQGSPAPAGAAAEETIVVTGSRVARSGLDAPTPRTVVGSELMENLGQSNVAEAIKLIPQNIASSSDTNVGYGTSPNVGSNFVNLRGLNPSAGTRTLTLVNTRRFVPSSDGGAVDLNVIPAAIISRVETVTGGASAAYGSDAVAGVVNVILDRNFTGFKGETSYNQTSRGDGKGWRVSGAWGTRFAQDRGHFAIALEYEQQNGVGNCSEVRSWCAESWDFFTNANTILPDGTLSGYNLPGTPGYGLPNFVVGRDSKQAFNDPNGVTRNRGPALVAARNKRFTDDGTGIVDFEPGDFVPSVGFGARQGGDGVSTYSNSPLRSPVDRYVGYAYGSYEVSPGWQVSGDLSFARRTASAIGSTVGPRSTMFINSTNAFMPDELRALLGGTAFSLGKDMDLQIENRNSVKADVFRTSVGLTGELGGGWVFDAYYQYGQNKRKQTASRSRVNTPMIYAFDAVRDPSSGNIVCAELLKPDPDPRAAGCVPLNIFGKDTMSQAAIDYVYRPIYEDFTFRQHAASASVRGGLFDGRAAGPLGLAAGVDFRSEGGDVWHHDIPDYQDYGLTFGQDYAGSIKVFELFGEANFPVFKDSPLGDGLEVNAAGRWTKNKSHNKVTDERKAIGAFSWKLGLIYEPISAVRFRATRSRDIRVAGFRELFLNEIASEPGTAQGVVDNPAIPGSPAGGDDATAILGGGSFQLGAEKADTTTGGVLFRPDFIPGLQIGVDWFEIKIRDAVTSLSGQRIVDFCEQYNTFCDRITYASQQDITFIDARRVNLGRFIARGLDIEGQYDFPLSTIDAEWNGRLNLRVLGTYQYDFLIQPTPVAPAVNYAGQAADLRDSGDFAASPKWKWNAFLTYSNDPFTATLAMRHIGAGKLDVNKIGPDDPRYSPQLANSISDNTVRSATFFSLGLTYKLRALGRDDGLEIFGVIDNLFDAKPPVAPGGGGNNLGSFYPTNPIYYDTLGSRYKLGLRVKL